MHSRLLQSRSQLQNPPTADVPNVQSVKIKAPSLISSRRDGSHNGGGAGDSVVEIVQSLIPHPWETRRAVVGLDHPELKTSVSSLFIGPSRRL